MAAANYNFTLEQGVPLTKTIFVQNTGGSPRPLTGFTAKMQLKQYPSHSDVLLELSDANGKININGPAGSVSMIFSAEDTASLNFSEVSYDLFLYNGSGTFRAIEGKITVKEVVTK